MLSIFFLILSIIGNIFFFMYTKIKDGIMTKKELIKKTAKELFQSTGEVTTREIARITGVNVASINYYFGNKQGLILEIEDDIVNEIKDFTKNIDFIDSTSFIETFINAIYDFISEYPGLFKYLLQGFATNTPDLISKLRHEIVSGDFNFFLRTMIKTSTGIDDELEINNRVAIFFTSISVSAITINAIDINNIKSGPTFEQFKDEQNFKLFLKTLMNLILKK